MVIEIAVAIVVLGLMGILGFGVWKVLCVASRLAELAVGVVSDYKKHLSLALEMTNRIYYSRVNTDGDVAYLNLENADTFASGRASDAVPAAPQASSAPQKPPAQTEDMFAGETEITASAAPTRSLDDIQ